MEDINCWESKFESCIYSDKLLNKIAELNKLVRNPVDLREVKKACYYARKYHGLQMRQSGEPYYSHPIEVAYMVAEFTAINDPKFFKDDLLKAAILHDTIEDTKLTEDMITKIFNKNVAMRVEALTRIKPHGKISSAEMVTSLWLQKKYDMLFIKQLDRLHNLQTIQAKSIDKIKKIVDETFNTFIALAMGAQDKSLEKAIYQLCCTILSIEMIHHEFPQTTSDYSLLASAKDTDIHHYLSQVFQNVTNPIRN